MNPVSCIYEISETYKLQVAIWKFRNLFTMSGQKSESDNYVTKTHVSNCTLTSFFETFGKRIQFNIFHGTQYQVQLTVGIFFRIFENIFDAVLESRSSEDFGDLIQGRDGSLRNKTSRNHNFSYLERF